MERDELIHPPSDAIEFGQRLLSLLDTGSFTTTYKYATLLAIVDETLASVDEHGRPPRTLTVAAIGRRVLELYWQQARPFDESGPLRQGMRGDLPSKVANLRDDLGLPSGTLLAAARARHPARLGELQAEFISRIGRYPIPLLQRFGTGSTVEEDQFIYTYGWEPERVPRDGAEIVFEGDAASHLLTLGGLLRPLIRREWAQFVAAKNQLQQRSIEEFLFGAQRRSLSGLRAPLREVYDECCFYCRSDLPGSFEIDHFLPWSKYPDDRLDNLVPAHTGCNNDKRDALASVDHLERWWRRFDPGTPWFERLERLETTVDWPRDPVATGRAARGLYLNQTSHTRLWAARGRTTTLDTERVSAVLGETRPDVLVLAAQARGHYEAG